MLDILTLRRPPSVALSSTCQEFELKNECLGDGVIANVPIAGEIAAQTHLGAPSDSPAAQEITFRSSGCATLEVEGADEE